MLLQQFLLFDVAEPLDKGPPGGSLVHAVADCLDEVLLGATMLAPVSPPAEIVPQLKVVIVGSQSLDQFTGLDLI